MANKEMSLEWLRQGTEEYCSSKNGAHDLVEDLENEGKLGQGFLPLDRLEEMDTGGGSTLRTTDINTNLPEEHKDQVHCLVHQFVDCFVWEYTEMPGLSGDLLEHRLPIKQEFRSYQQPVMNFNPILYERIKEEANRLLRAEFIRPCRFAEWVSKIVLVEKKSTRKIRICVDF
jgi:hypothetical protein